MKKLWASFSAWSVLFLMTGAAFQPPEWKDYSYTNDGFSLSAPAKPVLEKKTVGGKPLGLIEYHIYSIGLPDASVLISVNDLKQGEHPPAEQVLKGAISGSAEQVGGSVAWQKPISLAGNPGVEFEVVNATFHIRTRMYVVDRRLFTLISGCPRTQPTSPDALRIFDSLKLATTGTGTH